MAVGYGTTIVTSNLQFCIDVANIRSYPGSGTSWSDISSSKSIITLANSPTYSANNNGYFTFNGSTQSGSSSNFTTTVANGYTMEVWINLATASSAQGIFTFNTGASEYMNLTLLATGKMRWETYSANNMASNTTLTTSTWYQIVGTFFNSTANIYINGILDNTATLTGATITNYVAPFVIGTYTSNFFSGNMSVARMYNRALTATEVYQNFNALRGRYSI